MTGAAATWRSEHRSVSARRSDRNPDLDMAVARPTLGARCRRAQV